ncbi:hypothetical protein [Pseudoalteromonas obscura]|uniref:Lipoprotein n=1 Tax=Pseudoalteromonas obscura TaxID=3048491 RepID=A0ABT7EIJ0_9GAMM|nr:hypothetical protein [Pseudoalteromonas sp. P94(2023)]MDK2594871.1 hypothetical protein [Pseudoalteromonas sp. P94(2023)]
MRYLLLITCLFLAACKTTHNPIPENYTGPVSKVDDSFQIKGRSSADMFYISKVDGKSVYNAANSTFSATSGQGSNLRARGYTHQVTTLSQKLHLVGQTVFAAPINQLFNSGSSFEVRGDISFIPEENTHYIVGGELNESRSAVWIEDLFGKIVSPVIYIEEQGSEPKQLSAAEYYSLTNKTYALNSDLAEQFAQIKGGESVGRVTAKLGEPSSKNYMKANLFSARQAYYEYSYKGLGVVRFTAYGQEAGYVIHVKPQISISKSTNLNELLSTQGGTLQHIAKKYYQMDELTVEQLDQIANTIWQNRHSSNALTLDGVAWLIKTLAKQGNNRYYSLIEVLCDTEQYKRKITRHARKSLTLLTPSNTNQFKYSAL